ncbi:MAG: DUF2271 domain-containing protein [Thermodesulfobacteriota bacterium]|nr:DUF2271 domain-containing protein [Thermodesulfobacteriota bacterium]
MAEVNAANQTFVFHLFVLEKKCQIAIWLTDEQETYMDTVYVTRKTAKKGLGNRRGGLDDKWGGTRLSVLPVWAHRRVIDYDDHNFYPSKKNPLPDTITSATPKVGKFIWKWKPAKTLKTGTYSFYIEVNKAFDKNEHHDYSWYRGQPSVIWKGSIFVGKEKSEGTAKIIGSGHVAGTKGTINPDLSTLTTSLKLIEKAMVTYIPQ